MLPDELIATKVEVPVTERIPFDITPFVPDEIDVAPVCVRFPVNANVVVEIEAGLKEPVTVKLP